MKNYVTKEIEKKVVHGHLVPSVRKYMTRNLITFLPSTPLKTVVDELLSKKITGAPVLNRQGEVIGIIDDKDCLKLIFDSLYHELPEQTATVESYMSTLMMFVDVKMDIMQAADIFLTTPYKRLLVMDNNQLVGQISRYDVLRAIREIEWGKK